MIYEINIHNAICVSKVIIAKKIKKLVALTLGYISKIMHTHRSGCDRA